MTATQLHKMAEGRSRAAAARAATAHEVVAAHREYATSDAYVFGVGKASGFGSEAHVYAKRQHKATWPEPPTLPTKSQMVLVYGTADDEAVAS